MPSPKEYFEYNYLRHHVQVSQRLEGNKLHLTVALPGRLYFYYPSLTLNLRGISVAECATIDAGTTVSGLSYADFGDDLMINIDCRRALESHAEHFVLKYEKSSSAANLTDALYFVDMLKASTRKDALLKRLK